MKWVSKVTASLFQLSVNHVLSFCWWKQELVNVQEKNAILHARLETMLNEVADSVNIDQTQAKLVELNKQKDALQVEVDQIQQRIDEWIENYKKENDGQEPAESDRYVIFVSHGILSGVLDFDAFQH